MSGFAAEETLVYGDESVDKYHYYSFYINARNDHDNLNLSSYWYALRETFGQTPAFYRIILHNQGIFRFQDAYYELFRGELEKDIDFYLKDRTLPLSHKKFMISVYLDNIFGWYLNMLSNDVFLQYETFLSTERYIDNYELDNFGIESLKREIDRITGNRGDKL